MPQPTPTGRERGREPGWRCPGRLSALTSTILILETCPQAFCPRFPDCSSGVPVREFLPSSNGLTCHWRISPPQGHAVFIVCIVALAVDVVPSVCCRFCCLCPRHVRKNIVKGRSPRMYRPRFLLRVPHLSLSSMLFILVYGVRSVSESVWQYP